MPDPQADQESARRSCSECAAPEGIPVSENDLESLGDRNQVGAVGGGVGVLGLAFTRRIAMKSLDGLAFCGPCRKKAAIKKNPFRAPKVLAATGFVFAFTLLGTPIALVLFTISFVILHRRLKALREHPTASSIKSAADAVGTLAIASVSALVLILVMAGVVIYMLSQKI